MVHGKQNLQGMEGVQFVAVDIRKTYIYFPLLLSLWLMDLRFYSRFWEECAQVRHIPHFV